MVDNALATSHDSHSHVRHAYKTRHSVSPVVDPSKKKTYSCSLHSIISAQVSAARPLKTAAPKLDETVRPHSQQIKVPVAPLL